jgi:multiple sugar transport system substrate-binding protein
MADEPRRILMHKQVFKLGLWIISLALIISACQPAATTQAPAPTQPPAEVPATEPPPPPATEAPPASDKIQVRWFVGLGTGTNPDQIAPEEEVVADFNASQDEIELVLEVVPYDAAVDTLSTQIASGNGPDVIGPVGWGGSNAFYGQWLDMAPLIESSGYDTSQFSDELVAFYQTEEGQVGLPFAVFPAAVYYQPELFDEAGLNYPPAEYGEPYVFPDGTEAEWSWETLAEVAKLLTVDVNGNNATEADFDRNNIAQVGYEPQWQHAMHMTGFFGAGKLYDDGNNAVLPDSFKAAWSFIYDGIWGEQPFIATGALRGSAEFGSGNIFNSGRAAMAITHLWYTCCLAEFRDAGHEFQLAVLPTFNGEVHGRVDADTFRIWKGTKVPEAAFTVVSYLIGDGVPKLAPAYGALPARESQQAAFLEQKSSDYPFVTSWDPIVAGLAYPDVPSSEGYMPNYNEAWARVGTFGDLMYNDGTLDLEAEFTKLEEDLTVIFQK